MQLDHVFCFVSPGGVEIAAMEALGLRVSYQRAHPGQGTANACFVFENAFIELLWITAEVEARSSLIARTRLWERSLWRKTNFSPFGIAWRGEAPRIDTWPFAPAYLPLGVTIPVASDGDDPRQPMMFQSPGRAAPTEWPTERHGGFQHSAGWTRIHVSELMLPMGVTASPALQELASGLNFVVKATNGPLHGLRLNLERPDGSTQPLDLPQAALVTG